jgi:phosphate transport system protein
MRDALDTQLRELLEKIMQMGGLAEGMIGRAVQGVFEDDDRILAEVLRDEERVNRLQIEIDEKAVSVTVHQQPVARDVRLVFVAVRVATDVERIADQAVNIAQNSTHLHASGDFTAAPPLLREMADAVRRLVSDALAALVTNDVGLAQAVLEREPEVDRLRDLIFRDLLRSIITDPIGAHSALALILIGRNLERIGDHATNIAEEVIYLVRGRDIRHQEQALAGQG